MPMISNDDISDRVKLYTEPYKRSVFVTWYKLGKPPAKIFYDSIPNDELIGRKPGLSTIQSWINIDFAEWASELDALVISQINDRLVKDRVEMLERHTKIAKEMQDKALSILDDDDTQVGASAALKLLVEGIRIERESQGLPQAISDLNKMSDDKLKDEIKRLISRTPVEISPIIEAVSEEIDDEDGA